MDKIEEIDIKTMLGMQLYAVFTQSSGDLGKVLSTVQPHLRFLFALEEKGVLFAAGPFKSQNDTDWAGDGMIILRAESLDAATKIAESDPMHSSGARTFEVKPWRLNEGSFSVSLRYSSGLFSLR